MNKKGSYSIKAIILMFITLLVITSYIDIMAKSYTLNEIQNIMDTTGLSVLQTLVDDKRLKEEMLAINSENYIDYSTGSQLLGNYEGQLYSRYKNNIKELISTNNNISYFEILYFDAFFERSSWGLSSTKPQIGLDVVAKVRLRVSPYFNTNELLEKTFYSSKNNSNFKIIYNGQKNGQTEIIIRSVVRLVYR